MAIPEWSQEQAGLIQSYLELRPNATDGKSKRQLSKLMRKLDEVYWKQVEATVVSRVSTERAELAFDLDERLLIDMGLIDLRLVEDPPEDLQQRLLDELQMPGPPNHFYLTEWLEDRYSRYRLTEQVNAVGESVAEVAGGSKPVQARNKVFQRLAPHFEGLPGVTTEMVDFVTKGGLDDQILQISIALLDNHSRKGFLHRNRLKAMRTQILEKARLRAKDQATLKLFDMLDEIYAHDWRERYERRSQGQADVLQEPEPEAVVKDEAVGYLISELRFVKTLMPLGALAGGETKTCAVFLQDKPRITKEHTRQGLSLAAACDRSFNLQPVVLIAPFQGRGIFEWDRDSLVVPLVSSDGADDALAHAAGSYRMLMDTTQNEGTLRTSFQEAFPEKKYQQEFLPTYRKWVTAVGHGEANALEASSIAWFRNSIGPDCSGILAPADLRNLGPQTRSAVRKRLEKQVAIRKPDATILYRLAVLCWQDGALDEAMNHLTAAAREAGEDGLILLSLGLLLRARGDTDRAQNMFKAIVERVPQTIWASYATYAIAGEI